MRDYKDISLKKLCYSWNNLIYFLSPLFSIVVDCDDYDTDDSHESDGEEEEEEDDGDVNVSRSQLKSKENTEHTNPTSYSWSILRLALIKNSTHKIQEFVKVAGIELQGELGVRRVLLLYTG